MKPGYTIEYGVTCIKVTVIECCNFHGLNMVKFYPWGNQIFGGMENTVAIFKIKHKSK